MRAKPLSIVTAHRQWKDSFFNQCFADFHAEVPAAGLKMRENLVAHLELGHRNRLAIGTDKIYRFGILKIDRNYAAFNLGLNQDHGSGFNLAPADLRRPCPTFGFNDHDRRASPQVGQVSGLVFRQ